MIKDWNANKIISDLQKIYFATTDPRMDGFVTWGCKQDLYRVKFALDEMLKKCPTYAPEPEFLEQHDKEQVWKKLNEVQHLP
jgi:hypothetical protein